MAVAKMFPDPEKRGRWNKESSVAEDFSSGKISETRTVLRYASALADAVLAGMKPLNENSTKTFLNVPPLLCRLLQIGGGTWTIICRRRD
jgi:hypothetical protein